MCVTRERNEFFKSFSNYTLIFLIGFYILIAFIKLLIPLFVLTSLVVMCSLSYELWSVPDALAIALAVNDVLDKGSDDDQHSSDGFDLIDDSSQL